MARTPLARHLQFALRGTAGPGQAKPAPEVEADAAEVPERADAPSIAIVGAGLAGLTAAYRLKLGGCPADVYEASERIGGRCWTLRGHFDDGQIVEHGGELIDTDHHSVRALARELHLKLDDLIAAEPPGTEMLGWFDGGPFTYEEMTREMRGLAPVLEADLKAAGKSTTWDHFTERGRELDELSIADWIEASVRGGRSSRLGALLETAYTIEFGGPAAKQSSLNIIYLLGSSKHEPFSIFGASDERFHVDGGNDRLTDELAGRLAPDRIRLGTALVGIRANGHRFDLDFSPGGTRTYDTVVLALPFTLLRAIDYQDAGFEPRKVTAIEELGMGTNTKLHLQFEERAWYEQGCTGETFADTGYQNTWEVTRAQPGRAGILVDYTGGAIGDSFRRGTPEEHATRFLQQLEPAIPGLSWNGKVAMNCWPDDPWTRGSYSYWKVGQYTTFAGIEAVRQGSCHFAGEHTSLESQGYLNGAVESGERVANEILGDLG